MRERQRAPGSWRALLVAVSLLPRPAFADGGTLRLTRSVPPFVVSVFTAPEPLRVGSADVSVLVQGGTAAGPVLLDADVELRLRGPDGATRTLVATHATAANRLFQSALVELPEPGRWQLAVAVRHGHDAATVSCDLLVGPAAPRLAAEWPWLALPPLCLALFAWRERLRGRRRD